jgi:hypothetical protein
MSFLPEDYQQPKTQGGNYTKLDKGETVLRILSSPIIGWETWIELHGTEKPARCRAMADLPKGGRDTKHFWAMQVWNYSLAKVQIWQINQRTIQDSIMNLVEDKDWGDPKRYDLKINKTGDKLETRYTINPKPHSPAPEAAAFEMDLLKIDLDKLYDGEDPFA